MYAKIRLHIQEINWRKHLQRMNRVGRESLESERWVWHLRKERTGRSTRWEQFKTAAQFYGHSTCPSRYIKSTLIIGGKPPLLPEWTSMVPCFPCSVTDWTVRENSEGYSGRGTGHLYCLQENFGWHTLLLVPLWTVYF